MALSQNEKISAGITKKLLVYLLGKIFNLLVYSLTAYLLTLRVENQLALFLFQT